MILREKFIYYSKANMDELRYFLGEADLLQCINDNSNDIDKGLGCLVHEDYVNC